MLILIDTTVGKHRIQKEEGVTHFDHSWSVYLDSGMGFIGEGDQKIRVMTYYKFGMEIMKDADFLNRLKVIACDEFHNAFAFRDFLGKTKGEEAARSKAAYEKAISELRFLSIKKKCLVVALTATPGKITMQKKGFCSDIHMVPHTQVVREYEERERKPYREIDNALDKIQEGDKVIIYTAHIGDMVGIRDALQDRGFSSEAIWSEHNKKDIMSDYQYEVRAHIIDKECLPEDLDVLIINASCGTCINIYGHIDKVIVDDTDEDIVIQARGRYRDDLAELHFLDKEWIDYEAIEDVIGENLEEEAQDALCKKLNVRDSQGHPAKFPTLKKRLERCEYTIETKRISVNGKRITVKCILLPEQK